MLVSQYIFTACGKKKNGDFVLWSKSTDITDAEGQEIHNMMSRKNPSGVNLYEATEEQIRAACPTKYAFFELSTGKKVLAESNFIGKVYSDGDSRWGNFFIHAFVFDKLDGVLPMSVLAKGFFKDKFEYHEWHDEPCPDSLPQIEITPAQLDLQAVTAFLTPDRINLLTCLMQSVIEAVNGGECVTFLDTEENQLLWLTMIGLLLPATMRENATFSTQVTPNFVSSASGMSVAKPVAVRGLGADTNTRVFNFSTQVAMNKPAYDFINNLYAKPALGNYVIRLGEALKKSLISALEYVKDIENLCGLYSCSVDEAVPMYMLKYGRTEWFGDFDAYVAAVGRAENAGVFTPRQSAEKIYNAVFKDKILQVDLLDASLLKKIYVNGDNSVKDELIGYFLANKQAYGVAETNDPAAYVDAFYNNAPFVKSDFITYNVYHRLCERGFSRNNSYCYNYLIYDAFLDYDESVSFPILYEIVSELYFKNSYNNADNLVYITAKKPNLSERILKSLTAGADHVRDFELLFHIVELGVNSSVKVEALMRIIDANLTDGSFISVYVSHYDKNRALYDGLERELSRYAKYANFLLCRETYAFRNSQTITREDLNYYFRKFYLGGNDDGLYRQKVAEYLRRNPSPEAAFNIYSDISDVGVTYRDMALILSDLNAAMYKPSVDEILKYGKQQCELLDNLDSKLGARASSKRYLVQFARRMHAVGKDKKATDAFIENAKINNIYANISESDCTYIVRKYLCQLMEVYAEYSVAKNVGKDDGAVQVDVITLYNGLFYTLSKQGCFAEEFDRTIEKLNRKKANNVLADLLVYATRYTDSHALEVRAFMERYLDKLVQTKKIKKTYEEVMPLVPEDDKQAVENFAKPFTEKKKKGFLAQLFGFKDKK